MVLPAEPDDIDAMLDPNFAIVRRGFDPGEVRRALLQLAGELRAGQEREALLARQLEAAEARAAAIDPLDPSHLTKLLGDEVARILDAARIAAAEIRQRADEAATRLLDEMRAEAAAEVAALLERAQADARPDGPLEERPEAHTDERPEDRPEELPAAPERRPRRTGIDPARTSDLFATLRAEQD